MAKCYEMEAAEREANEIAFRFQNSSDVVRDMSRAYHADFSGIRMHEDPAAEARVRAAGTDALAAGADIYFKKGILGAPDAASRGLVAHELAHTMQQGIVAGSVQESAPAGAEQGGFKDWIKGLFGRKKKQEHTARRATDADSMNYMAKMKDIDYRYDAERQWQRRLFPERRAAALAGLDPVQTNEMSADLLAENKEAMKLTMQESNATWQKGTDTPTKLRVAEAFSLFGHRNTKTKVGSTDTALRRQVFGGSEKAYGDYLYGLDAANTDFEAMDRGLSEIGFNEKNYKYNEFTLGMTQDLYQIMENYVMTENGLKYMSHLVNSVKDADVFQSGQENAHQTPLDYAIATLMTGEGIKASTGMQMREGGYKYNDAPSVKARNDVSEHARKAMMIPLMMSQMDEENRQALPQGIQELFARYEDIKRKIAEKIQ